MIDNAILANKQRECIFSIHEPYAADSLKKHIQELYVVANDGLILLPPPPPSAKHVTDVLWIDREINTLDCPINYDLIII